MREHCFIKSPVGYLMISAEDGAIVGVEQYPEPEDYHSEDIPELREGEAPPEDFAPTQRELLDRAAAQLCEYFAGVRTRFDLPVRLSGTPFRMRVWRAMAEIPYGQTRTYGDIAAQAGSPGAARAVGGACHDNPIMIILPCHRVVGASGSLTGFGGGLGSKRLLLALEGGGSERENDGQ